MEKKKGFDVNDLEKMLEEKTAVAEKGSAFASKQGRYGKRNAISDSVKNSCQNASTKFRTTGKAVILLDTLDSVQKSNPVAYRVPVLDSEGNPKKDSKGNIITEEKFRDSKPEEVSERLKGKSKYPAEGGLVLSGDFGHTSVAQTAVYLKEGWLLKSVAEIREVNGMKVVALTVSGDMCERGLTGIAAEKQLGELQGLARGQTMRLSAWVTLKQLNPALAKLVYPHHPQKRKEVFTL